MEKLLLHCRLSPGDVLMLTAAVRALHEQHPGRFVTDVRTPCPALWKHNPFLARISDDDPEARLVQCHYPLIHQCNQLPYHFIHGYIRHLSAELNIRLEPTAFHGDIHLGPEEKGNPVPLTQQLERGKPYWIICAGGKYDFTVKWWHRRRWQEVVNHFEDRVNFVQVGESGHYHPPLTGVIDLRGRTTTRELIQLVYHSAGVVCPVTFLMHLAAAVPRPNGLKSLRPCVVVAGGREPVHWEAYPGHQFLHTIGALPCCAQGGCWKSRTVPLGDGSPHDQPARLCERPTPAGLPECMSLIRPSHVIQAIELFTNSLSSTSPQIYTQTIHQS
jgi:ADP-heptose:LPS heptosyltransferase